MKKQFIIFSFMCCMAGFSQNVFPTAPGTLTKVTPLNEVPIIPKATKYHLEFLLATKKVLLSDDF